MAFQCGVGNGATDYLFADVSAAVLSVSSSTVEHCARDFRYEDFDSIRLGTYGERCIGVRTGFTLYCIRNAFAWKMKTMD